jgi:GNAT superfamily N-acetyltransferase
MATSGDIPAIARVHVDAWRETYPGLLPAFVLDALTYEEREAQWSDALERSEGCLYVAEIDGTIGGFAAAGPNRAPEYDFPGELWSIYLLRAYQRRGLGRALFEATRAWLRERGLEPFYCWALDGNPTTEYYERMGATRIITQQAEIRGAVVAECAYAWPRSP